jgi:hypothetical protein
VSIGCIGAMLGVSVRFVRDSASAILRLSWLSAKFRLRLSISCPRTVYPVVAETLSVQT